MLLRYVFSKSCLLVVDFLRASGGFNSKTVLVESVELVFRLARKLKPRYANPRYAGTIHLHKFDF